MEENESFEYTYCAKEQEEVRKIRDKYMPREEQETKLEQLRRLDASVTRKGTCVSIILGVISTLIMGAGMSFCLELTQWFYIGVVLGIIGMIGIGLAYPVYMGITRRERERIAPQILKLAEELMQ